MDFDVNKLYWTRNPERFSIEKDRIEIITEPHTDLWQRTYYHFRNDNAPGPVSYTHLVCASVVQREYPVPLCICQ